ncbi:MAG TPA: hypothetical protein VMB79_14140, partial [Jatrophihabitans sp.]|nr:hypothetical protein [Jatrophihabitans sp.]
MSAGWVRVPVGDGAAFGTIRYERLVLVVARTAMTTEWLLDVLPAVVGDVRIQVVFTVEDDEPSAYHQGARALLAEIDATVLPWDQAMTIDFDLIICSTRNGSLAKLSGPLLITPHGAGYGKLGSLPPGGVIPVPRSGTQHRVPATTVMLSHPDQAPLFSGHPSEVRLTVIGDPVRDRLAASMKFRQRYRSALGLENEERAILLSSTWGAASNLGANPDLPIRLLGELPRDDYRVVISLHSNIWNGHGGWQVRTWLREAARSGAVVLPPGDHWRSALVAADLMIADHGSTVVYAAALGVPIVLGAFSEAELIADAPISEIGRDARRLDLARPLRSQLDAAIRTHDAARWRSLGDRVFAEPGRALGNLQAVIYAMLGIEPAAPPRHAEPVPVPRLELPEVTAVTVLAHQADTDDTGPLTIALERFP